MMPERAQIRFLLDEHYPGWLAEDLVADGIDAVALTADLPGLRGVDDKRVLEVAVARASGLGEAPAGARRSPAAVRALSLIHI